MVTQYHREEKRFPAGRRGMFGRLDRQRVCRTFSCCTALMRAKHNELGQFATGCPPFDKEVYGPIWDEARQKGPPGKPS